jgi:hypothetical protein
VTGLACIGHITGIDRVETPVFPRPPLRAPVRTVILLCFSPLSRETASGPWQATLVFYFLFKKTKPFSAEYAHCN